MSWVFIGLGALAMVAAHDVRGRDGIVFGALTVSAWAAAVVLHVW